MIYPVYCVRDKATAFMQPMTDMNDQTAIRNFAQAVNSLDKGMFGFAPQDFDLYKIGEFNDQNAEFTSVVPIQFIVNGASLVKVGETNEV